MFNINRNPLMKGSTGRHPTEALPDYFQPFLYPERGFRGGYVRFTNVYKRVLSAQEYPLNVQKLFGEGLGCLALMWGLFQENLEMAIAFFSKGPLDLFRVRCTGPTFRAATQFSRHAANTPILLNPSLKNHLKIYMKLSKKDCLNQDFPLVSSSLIKNVEHFYAKVLKLEMRIFLSVKPGEMVSGFVLQRDANPTAEKTKSELDVDWADAVRKAETLFGEELHCYDFMALLREQFPMAEGEDWFFSYRQPLTFACICSKELIVEKMLDPLNAGAWEEARKDRCSRPKCECCGTVYPLTEEDIKAIERKNYQTTS